MNPEVVLIMPISHRNIRLTQPLSHSVVTIGHKCKWRYDDDEPMSIVNAAVCVGESLYLRSLPLK